MSLNTVLVRLLGGEASLSSKISWQLGIAVYLQRLCIPRGTYVGM